MHFHSAIKTSVVLTALSAFGLAAFAADGIKDGVYEGTAQGRNGPVTVALTVDGQKITNVKVKSHQESRGISDPAISLLPKAILEAQSVKVDSISGATLTSKAILSAAGEAMKKAGFDLALLSGTVAAKAGANTEKTADIVILGSGAAGMAAALSATENGAKNVVMLEKLQVLGGSTGRSSGCVIHATDKSDEVNNFPAEKLYAYWMSRANNKGDAELLKKIAFSSKSTFEWVKNLGVSFTAFKPVYPGYEPLHLENPDPQGRFARTNGMLIVNALKAKALENGLQIMTGTAGDKLIYENGKVVGVTAKRQDGSTVTVRSKAVILATGGYDHNLDFVRQYARPTIGMLTQTGPGNEGDGLRMGMALGADTVFHYGKGAIVTVAVAATADMPKSFLYVDGKGNRFVSETAFYDDVGRAMADDNSQRFFRVYDSSEKTSGLDAAVAAGKALKADSLDELAFKMRIDAANFERTVARYNNLKEDVDFGKNPALLTGIRKAPFYAVQAEPEIIGTFGGLRINTDGQVLRGGKPIPGLYAAGEVANGGLYDDSYSYTGTAIQTALSTGRFAGEHAAKHLER